MDPQSADDEIHEKMLNFTSNHVNENKHFEMSLQIYQLAKTCRKDGTKRR